VEKDKITHLVGPLKGPDDLFVVELDERLEFGVAIIDSDLGADGNGMCVNSSNCSSNDTSCTNASFCSG
jgi:hypothetical protein